MAAASPLSSQHGERGLISNTDPATDLVAANVSATENLYADGRPCRGLLVGAAGTATLVMASGRTVASVPLQQGYNPLQVVQITTAAATGIYALR